MQNTRKVGGGATPSGIPVASTTSVVISNSGGGRDGTYFKKIPEQALITNSNGHNTYTKTGTCYLKDGSGYGNILVSPDGQVWDDEIGALFGTPTGKWEIINAYFDIEYDSWIYEGLANNNSSNTAYIPDTSWSPSITITAA